MKRIVVLAALLALVGSACATNDEAGQEGAQTRTVQVDGSAEGYNAFALAYFPKKVTLRPGDTVSFEQVFTGEPHSVTLGTLIDAVVPEARELGRDEPPAELAAKLELLPTMLSEGPGDANQVAVNPCFVESGALPTDATQACPEIEQPEFNGRQAYYNSGFLASGEGFDVSLADDIAPGTYAFYCNLHGPSMSGDIEVVAEGTDIPSADDVQQARESELEAAFEPLTKAYNEAKAGTTPFGNLAGYGSEEAGDTGIMAFLPEKIEAKVGEKVTWTIFGPHTITFDAPGDVGHPIVKGKDGKFHANPKSIAPAGGPGMPPPPEGEPPVAKQPEGPPTPTIVDGGSWDGEGFRSSGFFLSFPGPGSFFGYSLKFTKAGDYPYVCLIHPAMTGTVEVT